jgi:hypothetical protein
MPALNVTRSEVDLMMTLLSASFETAAREAAEFAESAAG